MAARELKKLRVATVRSYPAKGATAANLRRLMEILAQLAPQRPDVVVTPECWLDGYVATRGNVTRRALRRWAIDPATAPETKAVAAWAQANRAWVILGCCRRVRVVVANSALIYDRRGWLAGTYDKVHCRAHAASSSPVVRCRCSGAISAGSAS